MAKHFEAVVRITKTVYLKTEDSMSPETVHSYLKQCFGDQSGTVAVTTPKELTVKKEQEYSYKYSDDRFIDHTM